MKIRCPQCAILVDVIDARVAQPISCPSCGSRWNNWEIETVAQTTEPGRHIGHFELLNRLGMGHFGEVWSAHDLTLDRKVALKIPRRSDADDAEAERFLREARMAGQLQHPNIVRIHEVQKLDNTIFIVSDLIDGGNVSEQLTAGWRPTFEEAAKLCITVLDALQHAHDRGIIHRDIKPGNILIDHSGQVFLTDFGLAKREAAEVTMTADGVIFGTPAYMSPEQAKGDGHNADARSDVYSMGVMLFELLTGSRPFRGGSQLLISQIIHHEPPQPRKLNSKVPIDLQTICLRALEKAPERRFQTANEMAEELRRFVEGKPILTRPVSSAERLMRWARRNSKLASMGAVSLVLLVLLGIVSADNLRRPESPRPLLRRMTVRTYPAGAQVVCVPLDPETGELRAEKKVRASGPTPVEVSLLPGDYLVVAEVENHGFQEVYRHVPNQRDELAAPDILPHKYWRKNSSGGMDMPMIWIPPEANAVAGMVALDGGTTSLVLAPSLKKLESEAALNELKKLHPPRSSSPIATVAPFWLDQTELSIGDARNIFRSACRLPSEVVADWRLGLEHCETDEWPFSLEKGNSGPEDHPFSTADYDVALRLAELSGKRLMTEEEYVFAATNGGRTRFPWGNDESLIPNWSTDPQANSHDLSQSTPPIRGLYSGVAEWTSSWTNPLPTEPQIPRPLELVNFHKMSRVVRGAPISVIIENAEPTDFTDGPAARHSQLFTQSSRMIGVRLARSRTPRFLTP